MSIMPVATVDAATRIPMLSPGYLEEKYEVLGAIVAEGSILW